MSAEENKALVRRFMETRARADLNAIEGMLAPGFISHGSRPGHQPDREGYKRQVAEFVTAFSDVRFVIEDQVAQGDKVVSRISGRGTYDRKEIMSVAPTGREVSSMAIFIHRISGGKIAEEWGAGTGGSNIMGLRLEQERIARERVEQELEVARGIQQASLPEVVPTPEGWRISPFYQPAREVGGDFYDFHLLPDGRLGVVVGDATGKGVPAALVMSTTLGMLQLAARTLGSSTSPGEVLSQVNETLLERIPRNMFVTCFYAVLEPEGATLRYANAGHDPPYVRRGDDHAEELRARGMPLGLLAEMEYEEQGVSLGEGESVLLYSDGLVEAHDTNGQMFGFPRLRALVAEHGEKGSLADFLMEELYSFVGEGWEQEDDITLLTLQRSAS